MNLTINWVSCCLQVSSGAWQQLRENLALAKTKKPQELGVDGAVPPDPVAIEKIRHKFLNMRKMYSPEKKVSLLLRVCKLIYTIMQDNSGMDGGKTSFTSKVALVFFFVVHTDVLCSLCLTCVSTTPTGPHCSLSASFQAGCTVPMTSCPC